MISASILCAAVLGAHVASPQGSDDFRTSGYLLGVQAWSFNKFTAFEAVERTALAGGKVIEFFPGQKLGANFGDAQMGPGMTEEQSQQLLNHLAKHHVKAVAYGVTGIDKKESEARKLFQWAKRMGIGILNTESVDALDTMEKMVKEFDIRVGFHNHPKQPNNPNYRMWDPNYVLSIVKDRDSRIGSCADTGHWVRSGIKPVDAIRILKGRIISSHLKDLDVFSPEGHDVPYGSGVSDIAGILREYRAQNFQGSISVEYEYNWDNSVPDIAQCIGFVREYGLSLSTSR
jgi:sugar phosphate isomerase/epimerase